MTTWLLWFVQMNVTTILKSKSQVSVQETRCTSLLNTMQNSTVKYCWYNKALVMINFWKNLCFNAKTDKSLSTTRKLLETKNMVTVKWAIIFEYYFQTARIYYSANKLKADLETQCTKHSSYPLIHRTLLDSYLAKYS